MQVVPVGFLPIHQRINSGPVKPDRTPAHRRNAPAGADPREDVIGRHAVGPDADFFRFVVLKLKAFRVRFPLGDRRLVQGARDGSQFPNRPW